MPQSEGGYKLFKIGDLFEKVETKTLKYKVKELPVQPIGKYTLPALTAGIENQGLSCYVPREGASILKNVISVSANGANTGAMFYQPNEFTVLQDSYAIKLSKRELNIWNALFLIAALEKVIRKYYDWSNKAGWNKIKELSISLPVNMSGEIDFNYMESQIQGIEQKRVLAVETYIRVAELDDCTLTLVEKAAIDKIQKGALSYKLFKISDLFTQYRGKEKAPNQVKAGSVPMINETSTNNGLTKMASPTRIFEGNAITISINYATTVFYQPYDFCASVNISILKNDDILTEQTALYFAALLQKNNQRYDYNHKISKDKINDTILSLPVTSDGSIDYAFMENYINAIKKQTIARVKEYIDSEYITKEQLLEEPTVEPSITPLHIHNTYQPGRIPLYTLRAACGYFDDGQLPEEEGWIDATGLGFTPNKDRYFAVHAKGDSMLPKIHDGDICVFEWYHAGSRNGEIVLMQSCEYDDAYGGRYTIKRYHSEKIVSDEGWQHTKVELQPLNPDFDPIVLSEDDPVRTIGIFKCVLD